MQGLSINNSCKFVAKQVHKMKFLQGNTIRSVSLAAIVFLILGSVYTAPVTARSVSERHLKVLRSDEQAIDLELKADDFQIETTEHAGQTYQRLIIPDMTQSTRQGEPQVPTHGTLVGIPCTEGVSVEILDAGYETLKGYRLLPAPGLKVMGDLLTEGAEETFVINQTVYATDAYYPGKTVEIRCTGYMRDLAVAQVQFYPVQYNPVTGELRLYSRILARITWGGRHADVSARMQEESPAYENMLRSTIVNYQGLGRPSGGREKQRSVDIKAGGVSADGTATVTLKIGVAEDGVYKLTYDDITDAGLDLNGIDPRTIKISNLGTETPIYVGSEEDGKFDKSDSILFYGTAVRDIYTSQNVYWLTVDGENGQRMGATDGTLSGSAAVPDYFLATIHAEENSYYWQTIPDGEGQDHYFWGDKLSAPASESYSLSLNNISNTTGTATVRVRLKGRTDVESAYPDHHTIIYLNNNKIDDQKWDGQSIYDHEVSISPSYLSEGTNTVQVEAVGDTGASVDQVFVDWIEVDYYHAYVAKNDELLFTAPTAGDFQFEINGFSSSDVEVFNITDTDNIMRIANTTVAPNGGIYALKFQDTAQSDTHYLAMTPSKRRSPAGIEKDKPSFWKLASNGADYIIITHEDFYDSALPLANYRSKSGLRVATVNVEDIYDEFNYGIFNPQAIRDFLSYAYNNWVTPAPTYVLLVGDAYQDYKDNLETGTLNYVPTQIIETDILGETPSDNWFVLVSGDDILPDMYIGRLSAQSTSQVGDIVDKIIYYEKYPPDKSWSKNVLLVTDDDSASFEELSDNLAGLLPEDYTANKVSVGDYTSEGNPTNDILKYIDSGSLLVNYTGHGAVDRWGLWGENDSKSIFKRSDIASLKSTNRLTVVTVADCLNGFFSGSKTQISVAEEFQRIQDRGAVAVWAPTGLSYTSGHSILMQELYKTIFQESQYGLGAATTEAKINTYSRSSYGRELVETFVLFGDPATHVGISSSADTELSVLSPNGGETTTSGSTYTIQWEATSDMATFTLKYSMNKGRSWKKIAKKVEGTSYDWKAPVVKKSKEKCLVQVIGFNQSGKWVDKDISDSTFTIEASE